jgi:DNA polymerase III subunit delta
MQIYSNQLAKHLDQLMPCYLVFGDEPLQKQEAIAEIRQAGVKAGFNERVVFTQEQGFRWNELYQASQSLSLFSSRQIIELELTTLKPGQEGSKALVDYINNASPDTILLLHGPKAPNDVQKTKWFKTLSQAGLFVVVNQPQGQQFNQWIIRRAQMRNVNFNGDALTQFCRMFEGNLLAADQELEKLSLQLGQQFIDLKNLKQRVSNQSRYNLFELQDTLLAGQSTPALTILNNLKQQAVEPQLIFWAFNREFELLQQLQYAQSQRQPLAKLYQLARVWQSRQALYNQALQRLSAAHLAAISQLLSEIDQQIKCEYELPWHQLTQLVLLFCLDDFQKALLQ